MEIHQLSCVHPYQLNNLTHNNSHCCEYNSDLSTHSLKTNLISNSTKSKRRGRRSTIPPEYREQTRKLKKQNMERRRRACISDKMNALHQLAMNLIGEDPVQYQKIEKADILSMCYTIFENVVAIINEQPGIRQRMQQLSNEFRDKLGPCQVANQIANENSSNLKRSALNTKSNWTVTYLDKSKSSSTSSTISVPKTSRKPLISLQLDGQSIINHPIHIFTPKPMKVENAFHNTLHITNNSDSNLFTYNQNEQEYPRPKGNEIRECADYCTSQVKSSSVICSSKSNNQTGKLTNCHVWRPYLD